MQHFRYIDIIRRPDGTLRPWEEHNILAKYEQYLWSPAIGAYSDELMLIDKAIKIKDRESNGKR